MQTLTFELRFRKEAYTKVRGKLTRNSDRDSVLRDEPPDFHRTQGSYKTVSDIANRLNDVQFRSGFLDYLYFPEVVETV
jgi:hypothetical protein